MTTEWTPDTQGEKVRSRRASLDDRRQRMIRAYWWRVGLEENLDAYALEQVKRLAMWGLNRRIWRQFDAVFYGEIANRPSVLQGVRAAMTGQKED